MTQSSLKFTRSNLEQKKTALSYAIAERKSEIDRFWTRNGAFWVIVAASFVAYATFYDKASSDLTHLELIASFGFLTSLAWSLQNRGSKYWQESWELKVESLEKDVLKMNLFGHVEDVQYKGFWGGGRWSVSKLATAISDLAAFVWFVSLCRTYCRIADTDQHSALNVVIFLLVGAISVALLWGGRSNVRSNPAVGGSR